MIVGAPLRFAARPTGRRVRRAVLAGIIIVISWLSAETCCGSVIDWDLDGRLYEEPAGPSCAFLASSDGDIYGMSFGEGTWIRGTPIFGDFALSLFQNGKEDALFAGISMTVRIMPHWRLAPFVGGGGSFNYALSSARASGSSASIPAEVIVENATSGSVDAYWGGHVECGARLWFDSGINLIEAFGRYTWSSVGEESNYLLIGISTGLGW